ncbi:response regulator transcription factor [Paenibacillus thermotolerans]|uniref:response regulator transcription factor n=1 Tax=Paenibacillus thermotolerans TaxID=3027807 RepID=UPI0023674DBD|nr:MULTISPECIES: response regulator transcription factor [unclassified Paenibacillus]
MDKKFLIADEQDNRGAALEIFFRQFGHAERCTDGIGALVKTLQHKPDLIVLSSTVPKLSGAELCEQVRAASQAVIIMIAGGTSEDRIACYEAGADDVIGADAEPKEIASKAAAWLRRTGFKPAEEPEESTVLHFGPLAMNRRTHKTFVEGDEINLTRKEFSILWMLLSKQNQIVSRNELLRIVWSYEALGDDRMIDTHLNRIRKKLSKYNHILAIKTVWGVGYKLEKAKPELAPRIHTL